MSKKIKKSLSIIGISVVGLYSSTVFIDDMKNSNSTIQTDNYKEEDKCKEDSKLNNTDDTDLKICNMEGTSGDATGIEVSDGYVKDLEVKIENYDDNVGSLGEIKSTFGSKENILEKKDGEKDIYTIPDQTGLFSGKYRWTIIYTPDDGGRKEKLEKEWNIIQPSKPTIDSFTPTKIDADNGMTNGQITIDASITDSDAQISPDEGSIQFTIDNGTTWAPVASNNDPKVSHTVKDLEAKTYDVGIKIKLGNKSIEVVESEIKQITINEKNIPTIDSFTPTKIDADNGMTNGQITIDASITDSDSQIDGDIEFTIDNGKTWTPVDSKNSTTVSHTVKDLEAKTYDVGIQAKTIGGTPIKSSIEEIIINEKNSPSINSFTPTKIDADNGMTNGQITIDASITDSDSQIDGDIEFTIDNGKTWTPVDSKNSTTVSHTVKDLEAKTYDVGIQAKTIGGTPIKSSIEEIIINEKNSPSINSFTHTSVDSNFGINDGQITIDASITDCDSQIDGDIEFTIDNGTTWAPVDSKNSTTVSHTVQNLKATAYNVGIKVKTISGEEVIDINEEETVIKNTKEPVIDEGSLTTPEIIEGSELTFNASNLQAKVTEITDPDLSFFQILNLDGTRSTSIGELDAEYKDGKFVPKDGEEVKLTSEQVNSGFSVELVIEKGEDKFIYTMMSHDGIEDKSSGGLLAIILGSLAGAAIAIGAGIYFFVFKGKGKGTKNKGSLLNKIKDKVDSTKDKNKESKKLTDKN